MERERERERDRVEREGVREERVGKRRGSEKIKHLILHLHHTHLYTPHPF